MTADNTEGDTVVHVGDEWEHLRDACAAATGLLRRLVDRESVSALRLAGADWLKRYALDVDSRPSRSFPPYTRIKMVAAAPFAAGQVAAVASDGTLVPFDASVHRQHLAVAVGDLDAGTVWLSPQYGLLWPAS